VQGSQVFHNGFEGLVQGQQLHPFGGVGGGQLLVVGPAAVEVVPQRNGDGAGVLSREGRGWLGQPLGQAAALLLRVEQAAGGPVVGGVLVGGVKGQQLVQDGQGALQQAQVCGQVLHHDLWVALTS
jgi:hypothetical protein